MQVSWGAGACLSQSSAEKCPFPSTHVSVHYFLFTKDRRIQVAFSPWLSGGVDLSSMKHALLTRANKLRNESKHPCKTGVTVFGGPVLDVACCRFPHTLFVRKKSLNAAYFWGEVMTQGVNTRMQPPLGHVRRCLPRHVSLATWDSPVYTYSPSVKYQWHFLHSRSLLTYTINCKTSLLVF